MSNHEQPLRATRRAPAVGFGLALALSALTACEGMLDVVMPASLTDEALERPSSAVTQVNSVIAVFECAYSSLAYQAMGHEDVWERTTGTSSPTEYNEAPGTGLCDSDILAGNWYQNIHTSRVMAQQLRARLEGWGAQVPNRQRHEAVLAIYSAANLAVLGEFFCEMALDGGPAMTPDETLAVGEDWITTALGHISNIGDFAMPHGIAPSAATMAYGLRAQIRWARGNFGGALEDAQRVPVGFTAWVTRDPGSERRNKMAQAAYARGGAKMLDINDWWQGDPNPATGEQWPSPIPFTGYLHLGILPDGRAVDDAGIPIRTTVDGGAVADTRVPTEFRPQLAGPLPGYVQAKYTGEGDHIPLVNWREMWLIRAEIEGGQVAIDLVNDLRAADGLPMVTYAAPGNAEQIRYMVLEEKRRDLWLEGARWWSTKIQNTDVLWFPRQQGFFPGIGTFALGGAVRMVMPVSEYEINTNLDRATHRGAGCDPAQRPAGLL